MHRWQHELEGDIGDESRLFKPRNYTYQLLFLLGFLLQQEVVQFPLCPRQLSKVKRQRFPNLNTAGCLWQTNKNFCHAR